MDLLPNGFFLTVYLCLGLIVGSFLNVVIARVPTKESLNTRSRCPKCLHQIRSYDNIPVLSWLLLKGKCRDCRTVIPARYPLVEALGAASFGFLAWYFHMRIPTALDVVLLLAAALSIALAFIDFDTQRLPDVLVFTLTVVVFTGMSVYAWQTKDLSSYRHALISAAAFGVFYFALWFGTSGRGLGFGDVKIAPALGMLVGWFGFGAATVGFVSAFFLGGIPLGVLMVLGKVERKTPIPFGPFLIVGAWVGVLVDPEIAETYLSITNIS